MRTCILSIAGFDPSGGAGVLADIKTFEQLECTGIAVVTALTAQQPERFDRVDWRNEVDVIYELDVLAERYVPNAVKIGIVRDLNMLVAIVRKCRGLWPQVIITWDPVMKASAGGAFGLAKYGMLNGEQLEGITAVTPNDEEYEQLFKGSDFNGVVVRTGKKEQDTVIDTVYMEGTAVEVQNTMYKGEVHGSGCVFSSALTVYMARGMDPMEACRKAHEYVMPYLRSAENMIGYHT